MLDGIRHIRGFLCVARLGSFTRASIELRVSQPALTVQIQQLENAIGVPLLDRNKRRVGLSQAGEALIVPLERVLNEVDSVMASSRDFVTVRDVTVTVAALPSLAAALLPLVLRDFNRSYLQVSVRLKDAVGNLVDLVRQGEVDFGVGAAMDSDPSISMKNLYSEPICVFAPRQHPLARRRTITLSELVEYPAILPPKDSSVRVILERALERQRLSIRPLHESSHISTAIGMVSSGLGIAILPLRAIDCCLSPTVSCLEIVKPILKRRVVIFTKTGRSLLPAAEKLIEILQHKVRQLRLSHRNQPIPIPA